MGVYSAQRDKLAKMSARAWPGTLLLVVAVLSASEAARAQVGERGRITARSDVKLTIEGVPGTSGARLSALAEVLTQPLGHVQTCYAEVITAHPEAAGSLALDVELPRDGKLLVRAPGATGALTPMHRCIDQAFSKLDVSSVPRPAGARVLFELSNSSAGSAAEVRRREESASQVDVTQGDDGLLRSTGKSVQGEVTFEVASRERESVLQTHKLVRDALPGLFDCRRRAGKKASPAGVIVLSLRPGGVLKVTSSSVANERAPTCVTAVIKRLRGAQKTSADVSIRFAE